MNVQLWGKSHWGQLHAIMHVERLSKSARLLQSEGDHDPIISGRIFYLELHTRHTGFTHPPGLGSSPAGGNTWRRRPNAPFARLQHE